MNTNISIYKEPVVLNKGETKSKCDCGCTDVRTILHTKENDTKVQVLHCMLCTQDYYILEN